MIYRFYTIELPKDIISPYCNSFKPTQVLLKRQEEIHRKKGPFHLNDRPILFLTIDFVDHCRWTVFKRKF